MNVFKKKDTFHLATQLCETRFFIPNAFSPNGDGINDEFALKGNFIKDATLTLYNRWGQKFTRKRPSDPPGMGPIKEDPHL